MCDRCRRLLAERDALMDEIRQLRAENSILKFEVDHLRKEAATPKLFTISETAVILGRKESSIRQLITHGKIRFIQTEKNGLIMIDRNEVFDFIARNTRDLAERCEL